MIHPMDIYTECRATIWRSIIDLSMARAAIENEPCRESIWVAIIMLNAAAEMLPEENES